MKYYPVLFNFRSPVLGRSFLAGVETSGRALLRDEGDGCFWVDGVNPGAICAGGESRDEALFRFKEAYNNALIDFAGTALGFDDFKTNVAKFFNEETPGELELWEVAVQELRANPEAAGDWLQVRSDYSEPSIKIVCLQMEEIEPEQNQESHVELAGKIAAVA